jgi:membrane AbrB-like protein
MSLFLEGFSLRGRHSGVQWAALLALSAGFALALTALRLPAAILLSAIAAAAFIASFEGEVKIPPHGFILAQAVIGGMVARAITPDILREISRDWPLFVAAALSVILVSCLFGWGLARSRFFKDSTPIWGFLPGAASAMTLMANAYGADMRLVAFMQYLRVLLVALAASLVARFFGPGVDAAAPAMAELPVDWPAFGLTCLLLLGASWAGRILRIPAGPLLAPLIAGALAQDFGLMAIELPRPVLALSYALLGWTIGVRFTRDILLHALKSLPIVLASVLALLAVCGGFGVMLARLAHVDPMTAYLATSPGGLDAVAIIAASSKLDMPFVMALQTARILLVILIGPSVARFVADRVAQGTLGD